MLYPDHQEVWRNGVAEMSTVARMYFLLVILFVHEYREGYIRVSYYIPGG